MSINRWIMRCNNNITVHNVVVNALSLDNEPLQQRNDVIPAVIHWITGRKDVIWVAFVENKINTGPFGRKIQITCVKQIH